MTGRFGGGGSGGLPSSLARNLSFNHIVLNATTGVAVDYADTVSFADTTIHVSHGKPYEITHSTNVVVH